MNISRSGNVDRNKFKEAEDKDRQSGKADRSHTINLLMEEYRAGKLGEPQMKIAKLGDKKEKAAREATIKITGQDPLVEEQQEKLFDDQPKKKSQPAKRRAKKSPKVDKDNNKVKEVKKMSNSDDLMKDAAMFDDDDEEEIVEEAPVEDKVEPAVEEKVVSGNEDKIDRMMDLMTTMAAVINDVADASAELRKTAEEIRSATTMTKTFLVGSMKKIFKKLGIGDNVMSRVLATAMKNASKKNDK